MERRSWIPLGLFVAYIIGSLGGCGAAAKGPTGPDPSKTIAWRLEIASNSEAGFGVRMLLDGEAVYSDATITRTGHRTDVVRSYTAGPHVIEFEILAAVRSPAVYAAAWTVKVSPNGRFFHADGVPTSLAVGERIRITVPL